MTTVKNATKEDFNKSLLDLNSVNIDYSQVEAIKEYIEKMNEENKNLIINDLQWVDLIQMLCEEIDDFSSE